MKDNKIQLIFYQRYPSPMGIGSLIIFGLLLNLSDLAGLLCSLVFMVITMNINLKSKQTSK